jgi:hypothetical protein
VAARERKRPSPAGKQDKKNSAASGESTEEEELEKGAESIKGLPQRLEKRHCKRCELGEEIGRDGKERSS